MSQEETRKEKQEEKEKKAVKSKLGKEAKIGVSVILVLVVVLGGLVVWKMTGPDTDDKIASASDQEAGKGKHDGLGSHESMFKDAKPKFPPGGKQTTVVPVKSASNKPPRTTPNEFDKWNPPSNKNEPKVVNNFGSAPGSEPPFGSGPPKPFPNDRPDRHGDRPMGGEFGDQRPQKNPESEFGIVVSDEKPKNRKHRDEFGRAKDDLVETGDLARVDPAPPLPPPPHSRDRDQYGDPKPLSPAPTPWEETSSAAKSHSLPPPPNKMVTRSKFNERHRNSDDIYGGNDMRDDFDKPSYGVTPQLSNDGKYEVQPNDNFWKISKKFYKTDGYFKALVEANRGPGIDENNLKPGQWITIPSVAQLEKSYPDLCPKSSRNETLPNRFSTASNRNQYRSGRTYTVAEGDTLFNIARYELGKASRWAEIYDMNRDVLGKDYNYLKPGTILSLPENEKTDVLTRQPRDVYQR